MKRKTLYAVLLVCFAALISSANQNSRECKDLSYSQKTCCSKAAAAKTTTADAVSVPLNLFLFDL